MGGGDFLEGGARGRKSVWELPGDRQGRQLPGPDSGFAYRDLPSRLLQAPGLHFSQQQVRVPSHPPALPCPEQSPSLAPLF